MGLDMYLERKTYVKNWEHMKPEERTTVKVEGAGAKGINMEKVSYIVEEVAYWRKANQIHQYFIDTCADGDGDKTTMSVSREQLDELLDRCKKVLAGSKLVKGKIKNGQRSTPTGWEDIMVDGKFIKDPKTAQTLLPTQSGFFFGSTDYDEYYLADITHTIEVLESLASRVKSADDRSDYEYNASW